jgi:hypothetical protein
MVTISYGFVNCVRWAPQVWTDALQGAGSRAEIAPLMWSCSPTHRLALLLFFFA